MSRTLILMRHAKSSWDDLTQSDHDRPLNTRGRASASAMGDWLRARGCSPDRSVISDSARTVETYARLGLASAPDRKRALYLAGPEVMMEVLQDQSAASVLMLGHNPGIAGFASRLVKAPPQHPRFYDCPTCATTVIQFDVQEWSAITWHSGTVIDFAIPREVMA